MALGRPDTEWPLILCGPILRQVTENSVAVFVVTSESGRVLLDVFEGPDATEASPRLGATAEFNTLQLGPRFHLALPMMTGLALTRGVVYCYNVRVFTADGRTRSLGDLGLSGRLTTLDLGYGQPLPSFLLPSGLADLRLAYGSCRKAGGEASDALPLLDTMIRRAHVSGTPRPHLLILGGDQIYADDVPIPLLLMVREAASHLFGAPVSESMPMSDGSEVAYENLGPGKARAKLVTGQVGFTSGTSLAHLLFRAEFYAMYLFQWSDELWPRGFAIPTTEEVIRTDENALPQYKGDLPRHRGDIDESREAMRRFSIGLSAVRRVLANTPTLMVFDDHDVTDDWYITRGWFTNALMNPGSRFVIRNALAAYTLFQDWGNDPARYAAPADGIPARVLQTLATSQTPGPTIDLDQAFALLPESVQPDVRMRWDWVLVDAQARYQVVALDTRTWREFPDRMDGGSALVASDPLLSDQELRDQGVPMGFQLLQRLPGDDRVTFVISATPVLGNPIQEMGLSIPSRHWPMGFDNESWAANRAAHEDVLHRLASFGRVIILSGDVHYAFTIECAWWTTQAGSNRQGSRIVQLCSSALRNEIDFTRGLGLVGWLGEPQMGWLGFRRAKPFDPVILIGTENFGLPAAILGQVERFSAPAVLPDRHLSVAALGILSLMAPQTDWRYMLTFISDTRQQRQCLVDAGLPADMFGGLRHLSWAALDTHRDVVGVNNVGCVYFQTDADGRPTQVVHEIHWWLQSPRDVELPMFTRHTASFGVPQNNASEFPEPQL